MNALILSENKLTTKMVSLVLEEKGILRIDISPTLQDAISLLDFFSYHIIIIEWCANKEFGINLFKAMKAHKKCKEIPMICIGSDNTFKFIQSLHKEGVEAYIIKPFCLKAIKDKINTALVQREQSKKKQLISQ